MAIIFYDFSLVVCLAILQTQSAERCSPFKDISPVIILCLTSDKNVVSSCAQLRVVGVVKT